jgi:hypothetical protein
MNLHHIGPLRKRVEKEIFVIVEIVDAGGLIIDGNDGGQAASVLKLFR